MSPPKERINGSDRSWFNSTWGDVDTLHQKAVNSDVIKHDDVVWMAGKCEDGFSLMNLLTGIQTMTKIAEIFARICDYQDIPEHLLDSLVKSFFKSKLDHRYDTAREKLLAAFELHSQRCHGKISAIMESILMEFKHEKECTTKMKRSVWKIFAINDKHLEDTFMSAINQLLEFQKSKNVLENVIEELEFVGRQVTFSGRCISLQERFKFFEKLLTVIHNKDGHYSTQLRAEVANIAEDFLSHDLTSIMKLSAYSPWLEILVATYKTLIVEGSAGDQKNLERNCISCILRILDKSTMTKNADKNNLDYLSPPSGDVLGLLVDLCTKDVDRKLEALIVLTLGNLVNRAVAIGGDFLLIPGFNRLAYKLSRRDAVDDTASVYLQDESKIDSNSEKYTFISTLVGQILLYSIKNLSKNDSFEFSTLNFLVEGLNVNSNKMTRIFCAECLFEAVLLQSFSHSTCMGISMYVLDSVTDVQVYTSAVYCIGLKKICSSESYSVVSVDDLNLLSKLYAHDQVVVLEGKDYCMYINPLILEIFGKLATKLAFSEEVFQLLTFILTSEELNSKEILEIIENQVCNCKNTEVSFPNYCLKAVEEVFVSEPNLFVISALIVEAAVSKHEALYSDVVIEHAHKYLMSLSDEEFSREWGVSFIMLMSAHVRLHLPEHIFQDLDLVLTGLMLMTFLMSIDQSFKQLHEKSELASFLKPNRGFFERDEMNKEMIGQTLKCILHYQTRGLKLLYFHFLIMEHLLQSSIFSGNILRDTIQCLIYAVENRQSLSSHLIQNCVQNFRFEESELRKNIDNNNPSILSLAFALVNNNQTLPEDFVENLITFFCKDVAQGLLLGEDEEKDQIFSIISTISQNCQSALPMEELVLDTFCNLWNKSNDHKKGLTFLGALNSNIQQKSGLSGLNRGEAVVKKYGSFWKKSKSHRYRVEILNALSGICKNKGNNERESDSNEETSESNDYKEVDEKTEEVHFIFMEAVQDSNVQTLETGLRCVISLNWDGACYCTDEHLELIFSIQCRSKISPKTKNDIQAFFVHNRNFLHESLLSQLELLESILDGSDETLLKKLQDILSTRTFKESSEEIVSTENSTFLTNANILKSTECQRRLENILFRKQNQELNVVAQALKILNDYPNKEVLSPSIFEAVAFTMVNNAENQSSRTIQRIQNFCKNILFRIIDEGVSVSETLVNYIRSSVEHSDMFLKIINTSGFLEELPKAFRSKMELDAFCNALSRYCFEEENNKKPIVAGTNEKLGDLMTRIKQLDLDAAETCLDQKTLNCLLTLDLEMLQSVPKITYLIARSVATLNDSIIGLNYEIATRLIERAIIKQSPDAVQLSLIQAYCKIIADGYKQELEEVLKAFVNIFTIYEQNLKKSSTEANIDIVILGQRRRYKKKVQNAILTCILEAIKCENDLPVPFIPFQTFKMVVRQLQNPLPNVRHLAFQIVKSIESFNVLSNSDVENELKEIHIHDLTSMALQVFQQIYKEQDELVLQKILDDPNFVEEFMQFLYSITYWDFESVSKVKDDRTQWYKVLVISDFISCFAQCEEEKLKLKMYLTKLYNIFQEQKAQELIFALAELSSEAFASDVNNFSAVNAVSWLNQIDYDVSLNILKKLDSEELDPFQVYHLLQETALAKSFGVKYSFEISQGILMVLTRRLSTALHENLLATTILIEIIQRVDDVNSLEELVKVINEDVAVVGKTILNFPRELVDKKMSLAELKNTFECEILLSLLPEDTKGKGRINRTFIKLLAFGISFQHIKRLITLAIERTKDTTDFKKILEFVISQASQYKIDSELFEQIISSLDKADSVWKPIDCIDSCTRIINDYAFDATNGGVKSNDIIISELMFSNPQFSMPPQLKKLVADIKSCGELSKILKTDSEVIVNWKPEQIKMWADVVMKSCNESTLSDILSEAEFVREALMVTKVAFLLTTNFHMTNVQILACYFALTKDIPSAKQTTKEVKGLLQQVATGSGKSTIIAIISVIKSLQNLTVDVYTSNSVLAERDSKEWAKFYNLFGITTDHNSDKTKSYICGEKTCYQKNIVYGDCSQFQFDYLRNSYSDLGTLGERKCQFAIIDEVDTMFIDDSSKLARLSSTLPGMDLLHIFYHFIWDRLTFLNNHLFQVFDQTYYLEGQIEMKKLKSDTVSYVFEDNQTDELKIISNLLAYILSGNDLEIARIFPIPNNDLEKFVTDHLNTYAGGLMKEDNIQLPKHLKEFARVQIPNWVDSAITAVTFQENVHYIVDEGQIKPVDFKTTGVVQSNTNWNNGLHSFLQIKHGLRMTSETLTTNFMSNLAMIKIYDTNIIGFTATLGSKASQDLLKYVYKVDLLILPETHIKRNVRFPDVIVNSEIEWLQEILNTTLEETSKRRGVLIICETIKEAEIISNAVSKFKNIKVKMYTKNQENQERQIERVHQGDVIVATNLAGRGTDVKTTEIEKYGGLHVCLTFLPSSRRVDEQAFGRTSRQGKKGTGQLIITEDGGVLRNNNVSTETLLEQRDSEERSTLDDFKHNKLTVIQTKGELFQRFSKKLGEIRNFIKEEESGFWTKTDGTLRKLKLGRITTTVTETITLQAVEEQWAMFLRKVYDGRISTENAVEEYEKFEATLVTDQKELISQGQNCFYYIQLGNYEYGRDSKICNTTKKANVYFDEALKLDPQFSVGALVGKAYILLKGQENLVWFNSHDKNYKIVALDLLEKALPLVHQEMAMLNVMQTLHSKKKFENKELTHQLTEKMNLLGSYLKTIEEAQTTIEKSLRRVHCTVVGTLENRQLEYRTTRLIPNHTIKSDEREIPWESESLI